MANWLITGVSSGFGRALAEAVLAKDNTVAGTVRNEAAKSEFEKLALGKAVGILLDVIDQASVHRGVEEAEKKTGGIDVLVNNAGYGLEGAVEEVTLEQIRSQFEVNSAPSQLSKRRCLTCASAAPVISSTSHQWAD